MICIYVNMNDNLFVLINEDVKRSGAKKATVKCCYLYFKRNLGSLDPICLFYMIIKCTQMVLDHVNRSEDAKMCLDANLSPMDKMSSLAKPLAHSLFGWVRVTAATGFCSEYAISLQ